MGKTHVDCNAVHLKQMENYAARAGYEDKRLHIRDVLGGTL